MAFGSNHSKFTRSESLTTAVRHGRWQPAPAVFHGEESTSNSLRYFGRRRGCFLNQSNIGVRADKESP